MTHSNLCTFQFGLAWGLLRARHFQWCPPGHNGFPTRFTEPIFNRDYPAEAVDYRQWR